MVEGGKISRIQLAAARAAEAHTTQHVPHTDGPINVGAYLGATSRLSPINSSGVLERLTSPLDDEKSTGVSPRRLTSVSPERTDSTVVSPVLVPSPQSQVVTRPLPAIVLEPLPVSSTPNRKRGPYPNIDTLRSEFGLPTSLTVVSLYKEGLTPIIVEQPRRGFLEGFFSRFGRRE